MMLGHVSVGLALVVFTAQVAAAQGRSARSPVLTLTVQCGLEQRSSAGQPFHFPHFGPPWGVNVTSNMDFDPDIEE